MNTPMKIAKSDQISRKFQKSKKFQSFKSEIKEKIDTKAEKLNSNISQLQRHLARALSKFTAVGHYKSWKKEHPHGRISRRF